MFKSIQVLGALSLTGLLSVASCGGSSEGDDLASGASGSGGGPGIVDDVPDGAVPVAGGADPNAPPPLIGGGSNSAPLGVGCGPETASDCHPVGGNCNPGTLVPDHEVIDAQSICFFAEAAEEPAAQVEYVTEVQNGQKYVHLRVTFAP